MVLLRGWGDSWTGMPNQGARIQNGLNLMGPMGRLVVLKCHKRLHGIICHSFFELSCSYQEVDQNRVSWWVRLSWDFVTLVQRAVALVNVWRLQLVLGDTNECIEACGGTTNVAPDRASWLLIWQKTGKKTASPCESGAYQGQWSSCAHGGPMV